MIVSEEWRNALASQAGITTGTLLRFDFATDPVYVWTGSHPLTVTGTGDTMLDGLTFDGLGSSSPLNIGENSFSYTGSEALTITLVASDPLPVSLAEAQIHASEYQARPFCMWRSIVFAPPSLSAPAQWSFQRTRVGSMDEVEIRRGGGSSIIQITIQSHAARVSAASQSLWLDQKRFDPTDTSQDFASSAGSGHPGQAPNYGGGLRGIMDRLSDQAGFAFY